MPEYSPSKLRLRAIYHRNKAKECEGEIERLEAFGFDALAGNERKIQTLHLATASTLDRMAESDLSLIFDAPPP